MSYITYPTPTVQQALAAGSESEKYRHLVAPYCTGCGVDLGSQGAAMVPWALSLDLPQDQFLKYSAGNPPKGPIHLRGDVTQRLPFDNGIFDFVVISHVAEDFDRKLWPKYFKEWTRILRSGGHFICLVPDHTRWWEYVTAGGVHNFAHFQPQPEPGDMTRAAGEAGLFVISENYTDVYPGDYSMLMVAKKP